MQYSKPEPTPEEMALHGAKMRCYDRITPHRHRVSSKDYNGLLVKLKFCKSIAEVTALYDQWRDILTFRRIADLPALDQPMPKPKKQLHKAA